MSFTRYEIVNNKFKVKRFATSRREYEEKLRRQQKNHLKKIHNHQDWIPCLHDECKQCYGALDKLSLS